MSIYFFILFSFPNVKLTWRDNFSFTKAFDSVLCRHFLILFLIY